MQKQTKCALGLLAALGTVACGGSSDDVGDKYQGVIDASVLDTKFLPPSCTSTATFKCDASKQYVPATANANGSAFTFYNLGTVAIASKKTDGTFNANGVPTDSGGRPILPASLVVATSYDFADGCTTGAVNFDPRTAVYPETAQWSLFDKLPLAPATGTTVPFVMPLVHVKSWTGTGATQCNDIKDATSLTAGKFGGTAAEGDALALRAIIDVSAPITPLRADSAFAPVGGWYRGLLLNWLDGGSIALDIDGNAKTMDGVLISPATGSTEPAAYVFAAKPGDDNWSPVVRLRPFTAPTGKKPSDYKGLCYDANTCTGPDRLNITPITKFSGVLFVVGSTL